MSNRIERKDLEKSREGNSKQGSTGGVNVFHNPDRYKSQENG